MPRRPRQSLRDRRPDAGPAQVGRLGSTQPGQRGAGSDCRARNEDSLPPSVYALCKYSEERLCLMAGAAYQIPSLALRFFNVYGPRQALSNPYTGVLAIFASRLARGGAEPPGSARCPPHSRPCGDRRRTRSLPAAAGSGTRRAGLSLCCPGRSHYKLDGSLRRPRHQRGRNPESAGGPAVAEEPAAARLHVYQQGLWIAP